MSDEPQVPRRSLRATIAVLLAVVLVGAVVGTFLFLKKPPRVDVTVRFTPGNTLRFHMTMDLSGVTLSGTAPVQAEDEIQADVSWQVIGIQHGTATIVQTFSNQSMTSNGHAVTIASLPGSTITIGADGQVSGATGLNLFSGGAPGPAQAGIARPLAFLPGYPVRPGDTWRTRVSQPFWGSALSYGATTTFLRRETVGSADAAVLESDATVPVDLTVKVAGFAGAISLPPSEIPKDATATYTGSLGSTSTTSWIDPSTGSLLKTLSRGTFTLHLALAGFPKSELSGNGTGTLSGELSMQLEQL